MSLEGTVEPKTFALWRGAKCAGSAAICSRCLGIGDDHRWTLFVKCCGSFYFLPFSIRGNGFEPNKHFFPPQFKYLQTFLIVRDAQLQICAQRVPVLSQELIFNCQLVPSFVSFILAKCAKLAATLNALTICSQWKKIVFPVYL